MCVCVFCSFEVSQHMVEGLTEHFIDLKDRMAVVVLSKLGMIFATDLLL